MTPLDHTKGGSRARPIETVKSVIKEDLRTGIRYYDHHIYRKNCTWTQKKPRPVFRRDTGLPNQSGLKIKPQPFIMINAFTKFINALRQNFLIKISNRIKQSPLKKTFIPILKYTAILYFRTTNRKRNIHRKICYCHRSKQQPLLRPQTLQY